MKNNSIIVFFAILILANLVYGQSGTGSTTSSPPVTTVPAAPTTTYSAAPNKIAECIKNNCVATASDYLDCRAKCAGVPNPNASDIDKTNTCIANCNQTNADEYNACREKCLGNFYTTSAVFTSSTPTKPSPTDGPSSGPSATDVPTGSTTTPPTTSSSNSLISLNLYPLILLGICMVAGIFGISL